MGGRQCPADIVTGPDGRGASHIEQAEITAQIDRAVKTELVASITACCWAIWSRLARLWAELSPPCCSGSSALAELSRPVISTRAWEAAFAQLVVVSDTAKAPAVVRRKLRMPDPDAVSDGAMAPSPMLLMPMKKKLGSPLSCS